MRTTINPATDLGQRGTAMLLIATLLIALLAGGGVALYVQLQSTKGAEMVKASRTSLYCAEAGLAAARSLIATQYAAWPVLLDKDNPGNFPNWYPVTGNIDDDEANDYEVTIHDNDDEVPPAPNDPKRDNDLQVFMVSRCLKNPAVSRPVIELFRVSGLGANGAKVYRSQAGGGAFNSGNVNSASPNP